jgi:archaemetzincin
MSHRRAVLALLLALTACSGEDRAVSKRGSIVLVPIGPVSPDVIEHLQRELPPIVSREVTVGAEIARPQSALDAKRRQYRGSALLAELERRQFPDAERVVGIIDADTYAPGLNFIFGQANRPGRFAVVALPRLRESFRGQPEDADRFRRRALKEAVHELGHTFGFAHCENPTCVMHFSNSLGDTDRKSARFCARERLPE